MKAFQIRDCEAPWHGEAGISFAFPRENGGAFLDTTLFQTILVPVDFSPCSEEAFRVALALARVYQAEAILLHVVDSKSLNTLNRLGLALPAQGAGQKKRLRHHARLAAKRWLESDDAKGIRVRRIVLEGSPFVEISRTARAEQASLVVIGSHGAQTGNVEKIFFGSTAEKVVRTAGCPVLTVPERRPRSRTGSDRGR